MQRFSLYGVHKLISIDVQCDLDLWPLTSKINRVHPLITVNMSCKFDKEICNGLVFMVFTSVTIKKCDYRTDRRTHAHTTHRQTPDKVIPMCRYASQATQKPFRSWKYTFVTVCRQRFKNDHITGNWIRHHTFAVEMQTCFKGHATIAVLWSYSKVVCGGLP